jgi:hypothetical protein
VTTLWLDVAAFARLRCLRERRARMLLAEWERTPLSPRVRRVRVGRGPLSLQVLADDRERYPGGLMAGFIAWCAATGRRHDAHMSLADHAAFDRWLGAGGAR